MSRSTKMLDTLIAMLEEYDHIKCVIEALPRGYISTKVISGHTYHYRQWREGSHVLSAYVPEPLLNGVRQKIVIRKENEALLKIIRKDLRKIEKQLLKSDVLSEEQIGALREAGDMDLLPLEERAKHVEGFDKDLPAVQAYLNGEGKYRDVLLLNIAK